MSRAIYNLKSLKILLLIGLIAIQPAPTLAGPPDTLAIYNDEMSAQDASFENEESNESACEANRNAWTSLKDSISALEESVDIKIAQLTELLNSDDYKMALGYAKEGQCALINGIVKELFLEQRNRIKLTCDWTEKDKRCGEYFAAAEEFCIRLQLGLDEQLQKMLEQLKQLKAKLAVQHIQADEELNKECPDSAVLATLTFNAYKLGYDTSVSNNGKVSESLKTLNGLWALCKGSPYDGRVTW